MSPTGQATRAGGVAAAPAATATLEQHSTPSSNGTAAATSDSAVEKRRKRAAKKRARAEAKVMQQASQAQSSSEDTEGGEEGGQRGAGGQPASVSGSCKMGQQQQQRWQGKGMSMKGRKKQRAGGDAGDEFEVIPRESDSGEEEQAGFGGHREQKGSKFGAIGNARQQRTVQMQRGASSPKHHRAGGKQQRGGKKGLQRGKQGRAPARGS